jgi:fused signal recognition particle receptor
MRTFGEPPPPPTFLERLKQGLSKKGSLSDSLVGLFTRRKLDAATLAELEDALIRADLGGAQAKAITAAIAKGRYESDIGSDELRDLLAQEITRLLAPVAKPLVADDSKHPFVVLVAGVNGAGKTTTIGKMAKRLMSGGAKVTLAAGDTFRAAAIEQLGVWARRTGAAFVSGRQGGDAAGLAFEALEKARANGSDVLLIDTAGRLQNKAGLMAELEKIARVLKKLDPAAPHAVLLVLDATTGQNALSQVEAFGQSVPLTGLVMTKLDGTARGGILVALAARFGLPVHYLGVGEGEDDLQAFDAAAFARALTGSEAQPGTGVRPGTPRDAAGPDVAGDDA